VLLPLLAICVLLPRIGLVLVAFLSIMTIERAASPTDHWPKTEPDSPPSGTREEIHRDWGPPRRTYPNLSALFEHGPSVAHPNRCRYPNDLPIEVYTRRNVTIYLFYKEGRVVRFARGSED
jgi:hypothetical protein